jgi:dimethylamine monooxygenase subunit B
VNGPAPGPGEMSLAVAEITHPAGRVRTLHLRRPDGGTLPSFVPGSHVVLDCGDRRNAYSLTGPCLSPDAYTVSVLLRQDGDGEVAGGSAFLHRLEPGDVVAVSPPRSAFPPVAAARHHVFVAGGIGITPFLSHVRAAVDWGRSYELWYAHRPDFPAHAAELRSLCGDRLTEPANRRALQEAVRRIVVSQPLGTHLYVCGPAGLIDFVSTTAAEAGWPSERVHAERFSVTGLDPGEPFTVALRRSGMSVPVPSGVSLLDALAKAGVTVPNMCRQGVCGECRVKVLNGLPWHRDLFLSEVERAANADIMCCVSRGHDLLELDL